SHRVNVSTCSEHRHSTLVSGWPANCLRLAQGRPRGYLCHQRRRGSPRRLTTEPFENNVPSWSRDGRWIYFASNRSGTGQIWKMPAEGGQAAQVTKQGGFAALESTDAKPLYFAKAATVR